jgi:hypothetical protein
MQPQMCLKENSFTADPFLTVASTTTLLDSVPPPITLSGGQFTNPFSLQIHFLFLVFPLISSLYSLVFATGKEDILGKHDAPVRCVEYSYAAGWFLTSFFLLYKFYLLTNHFTNSQRGNIFNYALNLYADCTVTDSRYCLSLCKTTIR